ncbi:MAG TPA: phosphopentomutase [Acidobacteriota bacterium]|nr:phosphopentomutase [Acidobacteriota bacterium]
MIERAIVIVCDSCGIGEAPDAAEYGDAGSNTLVNTARAVGGLDCPRLGLLGLGRLGDIAGVPPVDPPLASFGRMRERSAGKDSVSGHWELMGIVLDRPFPLYPDGFGPHILEPFRQKTGRGVLGNKPASGTAIIAELGKAHIASGSLIVYTSADSVFQIAAHELIVPIEELYRYCRIARDLLTGADAVGRVIARPFVGKPGAFTRTERRRDFALRPPEPTLLDRLTATGVATIGIGKIEDLFAASGLAVAIHTKNNEDGMDQTLAAMAEYPSGLIFTNLIDFDMVWGHRNDPVGYARGLAEFDRRLGELVPRLAPTDALFLVADHGCDPTTPSTDHSRELVPLLVYGPALRNGLDLGLRESFSDLAATLADLFRVPDDDPVRRHGTSFWSAIAPLSAD